MQGKKKKNAILLVGGRGVIRNKMLFWAIMNDKCCRQCVSSQKQCLFPGFVTKLILLKTA